MSTPAKSLSVVVPVHNAERNLTQRIGRLLEVLPDLAAKFEVLIVDDGSTDQTEDVALELSQQFPQVRVTRHPEQRGIEASIQTGAAHTTGDVVIVHPGHEPVNASHLLKAWQHRKNESLVVTPASSNVSGIDAEVLEQLAVWRHGVANERMDAPDRGRPLARHFAVTPPSEPRKVPLPTPIFRFSGFDGHSSMHQ